MLTKCGLLTLHIEKKADKVHIKVTKPEALEIIYKLDFEKLGLKSINDIILDYK